MFNYKYSEAAKAGNVLLAPGEATFCITSASTHDDKHNLITTKDGTPCLMLKMMCEDCNGASATITYKISENMGFALHTLGLAIGLEIFNDSGLINEKILVNKSGKCTITHFKFTGNDGTEKTMAQLGKFIPTTEPIKSYNPYGV